MEVRDRLVASWSDLADLLECGDNDAAADCDIVVIATPWDSAATTAQEYGEKLNGKVVISMANALVRVGREFQPLVPPRGSVAAHVQAAVPRCRVVAAFHHLPASELGHLESPIDSDVLICSDDPAGRRRDRQQDPWLSSTRRRRALQCDGHRGVHGRAPAAQHPVQDASRAEADGHTRRPAQSEGGAGECRDVEGSSVER
jgi:hypothetical protein